MRPFPPGTPGSQVLRACAAGYDIPVRDLRHAVSDATGNALQLLAPEMRALRVSPHQSDGSASVPVELPTRMNPPSLFWRTACATSELVVDADPEPVELPSLTATAPSQGNSS